MRLLAIRLDAAGDVLMCSPALHALACSGHEVTLLTSTAGAMAGKRIDALGLDKPRVLTFEAPWMKASSTCTPETMSAMIDRLRALDFDGAVIFTSHTQSPLPAAMMCQMAGLPLRLAHCRENPYQLLTHWLRDDANSDPASSVQDSRHGNDWGVRHEVQRQLDLVAVLGCKADDTRLRIRMSDVDHAAAAALLQSVGIADGQPFVLLHPGASAPSRRYPARRWHVLLPLLSTGTGLPLVIAGGPDELALASSLSDWHDCASVAGKTDFGSLAALIARASVLVACNSSPAHLAAATGTPVVDLYALTNLQHTPWQVPHRLLFHPVPCSGCLQSICPQPHHACLDLVPASAVLKAVQDLLGSGQELPIWSDA